MNFTVVKPVSLLNIDMGCSVIAFNGSKMSFNTTIFVLPAGISGTMVGNHIPDKFVVYAMPFTSLYFDMIISN